MCDRRSKLQYIILKIKFVLEGFYTIYAHMKMFILFAIASSSQEEKKVLTRI